MHSYNNAYAYRLITNIARAGLHMVTNPLDNAVLQGRFDTGPIRRGHTRVKELLAAGVNVCVGHDSVMDPWYPLGYGDPLQAAFVLAHLGQMSGDAELRQLIEMITANPARRARASPTTAARRRPGRLVVFDAPTEADALRLVAPRTLVLRGGEVVARTTPGADTRWSGTAPRSRSRSCASDRPAPRGRGRSSRATCRQDGMTHPARNVQRLLAVSSPCSRKNTRVQQRGQHEADLERDVAEGGDVLGHDADVHRQLVGEKQIDTAIAMAMAANPGPRVVLAVEEEPVDALAAAQVLVGEEHAKPRADPVRDDQQEVLVLLRPRRCRPDSARKKPTTPNTRATIARRSVERQPDAEREERHRAGVDVERVRAIRRPARWRAA